MKPELQTLIGRLRELEVKAANGALPGVRREWRAEVDDHSTLFPGIYAEGYSVLVDERCEADYSDLRLIAETRNALPAILDALEEAERIAQLPREYLALPEKIIDLEADNARLTKERDDFRDALHPLMRETASERAKRHIFELEFTAGEREKARAECRAARDDVTRLTAERDALEKESRSDKALIRRITIVCPHCPEEGTCDRCEGAGVIVDGDRAERDEWSRCAEVLGLAPYGGCYGPEAVLPAVKRLKAERDDSIGKARRGREWASAEIARLTARVAELERELDDDASPADEARLDEMVKRTMTQYETRIEEQKRLATAESRVAELEAKLASQTEEYQEWITGPTPHELLKRIAAFTARVAGLEAERVAWREWSDKNDEWSGPIDAAFPTKSGSHREYATAMQMVGRRHSKGALVALVNWLLVRVGSLEGRLSSTIDVHQRATQASHEHFNESRSALDARISALEDTIDLERAKAIAGMCTCGVCDPNVTELASIANAAATISAIESRRGAGWKGAR